MSDYRPLRDGEPADSVISAFACDAYDAHRYDINITLPDPPIAITNSGAAQPAHTGVITASLIANLLM